MHDEAATVTLRINPSDSPSTAKMWFELAIEDSGWASLYFGVDDGSRPCTQTIRLALSSVYDPLPDLAVLAEHASTGSLPHTIEIESEGPVSRLSITSRPFQQTAIFEVRDPLSPVMYFAAEVDPEQLGIALAHALRTAIFDPARSEAWDEWYLDDESLGPRHTAYWGNAWLRNVDLDNYPRSVWYFDGIDTWNGSRYIRR